MGCTEEIARIAIENNPEWICLVPEKREEKTTEGGLDLSDNNYNKVKQTMALLKNEIKDVKISLFVEADDEVMKRSIDLGADAVEIHTGAYAIDFIKNRDLNPYYDKFRSAYELINKSHLTYHAGHGLTLDSVLPLLELEIFEEYNIGHWIIAQSVFDGISPVTRSLVDLFAKHPLLYRK